MVPVLFLLAHHLQRDVEVVCSASEETVILFWKINASSVNGVELGHRIRFGFTHDCTFANVPVAIDYGVRTVEFAVHGEAMGNKVR